jgi:large subunit ribosomal protein L25
MTKQTIEAQIRTVKGKKVKKLRAEGFVPATLYGAGIDSITIQLNNKEMEALFEEVGESSLVDIKIEKDVYPVLLRNPQYNIMDESLMHIDCYKVNLKEKITATVPIELIGEAPGVKLGNSLIEVTNELEIEALPADLPEKFEIDISGLEEVDAMITAGDIKLSDKWVLKSPADQVIVKLEAPRVEEEVVEEEELVAPGDVPASEQKTDEEKAEAEAEAEAEKPQP